MKTLKSLIFIMALSLVITPAFAQNPYSKDNNSWITLDGTVVTASPSYFQLDYGKGLIAVEMDDWDWYQEGKNLREGDRVTVWGFIDDDFLELRSIEASAVYVKGLNTFFYASSADEEDYYLAPERASSDSVNWMVVTGSVTSVDGREFTIDTGKRQLKVDTDEMIYNPLDDIGYQKIKVGDRVRVSGPMDYDLFEKREIKSEFITTLKKDKTKES